jgi:hypothetical protein
MPVATTPSDSPRPSTLVKMEDRKRSAIGSTDDLAPPSKRVAVNGSKVKDDALEMKEETWVDVSATPPPAAPRHLPVTSSSTSLLATLSIACNQHVRPFLCQDLHPHLSRSASMDYVVAG